MTVRELIELLSQQDPDKEVYLYLASGNQTGPAYKITELEDGVLELSDNPKGPDEDDEASP